MQVIAPVGVIPNGIIRRPCMIFLLFQCNLSALQCTSFQPVFVQFAHTIFTIYCHMPGIAAYLAAFPYDANNIYIYITVARKCRMKCNSCIFAPCPIHPHIMPVNATKTACIALASRTGRIVSYPAYALTMPLQGFPALSVQPIVTTCIFQQREMVSRPLARTI